ncbi:MAG: type I secretion system permease/ATPase [Novosphingobium sp.]
MIGDVPPETPHRFARWLAGPMLRNRRTYLQVAMAAAMINLFGLAASLFSMTVYDRVIPNNALSSLAALAIGLAIVLVFDFILRILRAYFVDVAGANIDRAVGSAVFARLLAMRLDRRRGSTGALTNMMRELETLREFFASATLVGIVDVPFIAITLAVTAAIGGWVVLAPLAMVPLVIAAGWMTRPALDRLSARSLREGIAKQAVLVEAIGAIDTVKACGAGPLLARRWDQAIVQHSDSALRQRLVTTIAVTVAASANAMAYAGVVIIGVFMIADRTLTTGGLVACSILAGRAVAPLGNIAQLLARLSATRTAYRQVDELMREAPEGPAEQGLAPIRLHGRIALRAVDFAYPGQAEKVFEGLSIAIEAGERVAVMGPVGSGKSTLGRLILGLNEPQGGAVLVDGVDLRQYEPAALRRQIGAVLQDGALLSGTVRENIALGRGEIDQAELLRAAEVAGAHAFIGRIVDGYERRLADRGEGLSGGQRQAIALARALAGRPPILLLDEPTSAMDPAAEQELLRRLDAELAGRTVLLITHRPALLKLVERLVIVDAGRIVADGPRDAVLERLRRRPQQVA